jgi:hypothetical protein
LVKISYSIGWIGAETEAQVFWKMPSNFRNKRMLITTIGAKNKAFAIFSPPPHFSSNYLGILKRE